MFYGKPSRVELQKLFKGITSILSLLSHVEPKVLRTTNSNCGTLRKKLSQSRNMPKPISC